MLLLSSISVSSYKFMQFLVLPAKGFKNALPATRDPVSKSGHGARRTDQLSPGPRKQNLENLEMVLIPRLAFPPHTNLRSSLNAAWPQIGPSRKLLLVLPRMAFPPKNILPAWPIPEFLPQRHGSNSAKSHPEHGARTIRRPPSLGLVIQWVPLELLQS